MQYLPICIQHTVVVIRAGVALKLCRQSILGATIHCRGLFWRWTSPIGRTGGPILPPFVFCRAFHPAPCSFIRVRSRSFAGKGAQTSSLKSCQLLFFLELTAWSLDLYCKTETLGRMASNSAMRSRSSQFSLRGLSVFCGAIRELPHAQRTVNEQKWVHLCGSHNTNAVDAPRNLSCHTRPKLAET